MISGQQPLEVIETTAKDVEAHRRWPGGRVDGVRIAELVPAAGGVGSGAWDPDALWTGGASVDSRSLRRGDLFFALSGERTDGHRFIRQAFERGAVAAVVERRARDGWSGAATGPLIEVESGAAALTALARWYRAQINARVVAVTGSMGKTTTKELVAAALDTTFEVTASEGNRNNELGLPLSILAIRPEHEVAVLEMGASRRGDIAFLASIAQPDAAVITGVAQAHLASFGSIEGVLATKWELAEAVLARPGGVLVVNGDDPRLAENARRASASLAPGPAHHSRVVTYGFGPGNTLRATDERAVDAARTPPGASMVVDGVPVGLTLLGRGALYAALAAAALAREFGVPLARVAQRLATIPPMAGRLFVHAVGETVLIDDAYNASPAAVANALEVLAAWPAEARRIAVLGDMLELGESARQAHREIGRHAAASGIDLIFIAGEFAGEIEAGARAAGYPASAIHRAGDRDELALSLSRVLRPRDVVLLKASRRGRFEEVARVILGGGGA